MNERGHLYVIDGDLTRIACDAWLLPTDDSYKITSLWHRMLSDTDLDAHNEDGRWLRPSAIEELGGRYVARYGSTAPDDPQIFLGKIGGGGPAAIRGACTEFLSLARPAALARASTTGRRPLLAVNALGTGRGGMNNHQTTALTVLISHLDALLESEFADIDVVLVCFGEKQESVAQSLRRSMLTQDAASDPRWQFDPQFHDRLHAEASRIAGLISSGNVSIFMGAGVSAGAGLMAWDDLLVDIGRLTDPPTRSEELQSLHDNRDVAALLKKRLERSGKSLEEELRSRLHGTRFSLQHGLIASLPCSEFITTNVDYLFELAAELPDTPRLKSMPSRDGVQVGDRWLLKLHGSVEQNGSLVFTREHYIESFKANRALVGLVQSMLLTRHMLFVGYGLRDEDFHELVHEVNAARGADEGSSVMGTVLALFDDPTRSDLWSGIVSILPMRPAPDRNPGGGDFQGAVRDLERFLDLIGFLSADVTKFVLSPKFDQHQSESHRALIERLDRVISAFDDDSVDTSGEAWRLVEQTLRALGATTGDQ